MATISTSLVSCSVTQLFDIQISSEAAMGKMLYDVRISPLGGRLLNGHVIFSDVAGNRRAGTRLANYIRKHDLGTVTESPEAYNRNSTHMIKMYVWTPDAENFSKWVAQYEKKKGS